MAKGFFTQGFCLLTDGTTSVADVRKAIESAGIPIAKEVPASENQVFGGPSLIVPFREDNNGYVSVDVVSEPWPDSMGDPKSDPMTFGAWSMGHFGPFAFPGSLSRAIQHCWTWPDCPDIARRHRGYIRLRLSYVFGADDTASVRPAAYDALPELLFLNRLTLAVLKSSGVLCYFNPNGEVLRDFKSFAEFHKGATDAGKIPLQLWTNVRYFDLNARLSFMDTVGNAQLDVHDVEAIFPQEQYDPGEVDYYLRNVTHYLLDSGTELKTGEAIDGPGETNLSWTIESLDSGLVSPPRKTVRLYPKAERRAVIAAVASVSKGPN